MKNVDWKLIKNQRPNCTLESALDYILSELEKDRTKELQDRVCGHNVNYLELIGLLLLIKDELAVAEADAQEEEKEIEETNNYIKQLEKSVKDYQSALDQIKPLIDQQTNVLKEKDVIIEALKKELNKLAPEKVSVEPEVLTAEEMEIISHDIDNTPCVDIIREEEENNIELKAVPEMEDVPEQDIEKEYQEGAKEFDLDNEEEAKEEEKKEE